MEYLFSSIILFFCFALAAQTPVLTTAQNQGTIAYPSAPYPLKGFLLPNGGFVGETSIVYVSGEGTIAYPKLTLEGVLDNISFPKESGIYKSLSGLVHCWYGIALEENCSQEEAAMVALEKLVGKLDEMAGWGNK